VASVGGGDHPARTDRVERVLAEQVAYYRASAREYNEGILDLPGGDELDAALQAFKASGDILELACGPGTWTPHLLRHADTVTAVDASPEMLAIASARVLSDQVRFIEADLFDWRPERRFDVVFFGFWLSHVPLERFEPFWSLVADCLNSDGRVFFVDDAYRAPDELIEGEASSTVCRRLSDGTAFRAVKVPHDPAELEGRLTTLGWSITVHPTGGPFFWGVGTPP
jgi:SAM-dependent methyltransferase